VFTADSAAGAPPLEGTSAVRGQPRTNTYWHPEKLLRPEHEDGDEDEDEDEP